MVGIGIAAMKHEILLSYRFIHSTIRFRNSTIRFRNSTIRHASKFYYQTGLEILLTDMFRNNIRYVYKFYYRRSLEIILSDWFRNSTIRQV